MKFLILGCGSFAGQTLFADFLKKDTKSMVLTEVNQKIPGIYWEWIFKKINHPINWQELNLYTETSQCIEAIKRISPTHIIDFMGQGMVAPSWGDPLVWYETNVSRKSLLLETIRNLDSLEKYVRASTPEVYGSNDNLISERQPFNPSTPYAVSHSAIDFHIRCLGKAV